MPIPSILFNSAVPRPLGTALASTVSLGATSQSLSLASVAGISSFRWIVASRPKDSTCAVPPTAPSNPFNTTVGPFDVVGTYIIRGEANGDGTQAASIAISVNTASGLRIPALGEQGEWDPSYQWHDAYKDLAMAISAAMPVARVMVPDAADYLWWKCDETSGTTLANSIAATGTSGDLTIEGPVDLGAPSILGRGVQFNNVPSGDVSGRAFGAVAFPPSGDTSISVWYRQNQFANYGRLVFRPEDDVPGNLVMALTMSSGSLPNCPRGETYNGNAITPVAHAITSGDGVNGGAQDFRVIDGAWSHLGLTYQESGGALKMYLNGQLIAATTGAIVGPSTGVPWCLGSDNHGTDSSSKPLNGVLCDVRIASITRPASYYEEIWKRGMGWYSL